MSRFPDKVYHSTTCHKCGALIRVDTDESDITHAIRLHWEKDAQCIRAKKLRELFGEKLEKNCQSFYEKDFDYGKWLAEN